MKLSGVWAAAAVGLLLPAGVRGAPSLIRWRPAMEPGSGGFVVAVSVSPWDGKRVLASGDLLGITLSTDGGDNWQPAFGLPSYEMGSFTWHPSNPNIVWAGSMSGPCRSLDGGLTWKAMRNGMSAFAPYNYSVPIEKVLFDPADETHLIALGGSHRKWESPPGSDWGSIWQSYDSGSSWARLSRVGDGSPYGVMAGTFAAGALYIATSAGGILKSPDRGATWQAINNGLTNLAASYITADPEGKTLYAAFFSSASGAPGGVFRSVDAGASWHPILSGLTQFADGGSFSSSYATVELAPSQPSLLLTADLSWLANTCYRSTDGGDTWKPAADGPHFYWGTATAFGLAFDPHDANSVFMATIAAINRSHDGGLTWQDATASPLDSGNWVGRGFSGLVATNVAFNPSQQQTVLMAMDDGKWVQSGDGGASWRWGGNGLNHYEGGDDATFAGPEGETVYATFGQQGSMEGLAKSANGGRDWTYVTPAGISGQPLGIYALARNPDQVWFTVNGALYSSSNGGSTWARVVSNGIGQDGGLRFIAAAGDDRTFYVNGATGVWSTNDAGSTYTLMAGSPAGSDRMIVDPTDSARLYLTKWRTGSGDGLYRYDGHSWTLLRAEYAARGVAVDPTDAQRILLSTDDDPYHDVTAATGVWMSEDGGATWTRQNEGLPVLRGPVIRFVPWDPSKVIFGTNGRGFWVGTIHRVADGKSADIGGIVNAASFTSNTAVNGFITIFGTNFTSAAANWTSAISGGRILPIELGGVEVRINGRYTYPSYVSPTQLNVLMPDDPDSGPVTVEVVTDNGVASATGTQWQASPEFFAWQQGGVRYAVALFANSSIVVGPAQPAHRGDILQLYATGLGPTSPPWPAGYVFLPGEFYPLTDWAAVQVTVGGQDAPVLWTGMVEAGLYQINAQIPASTASGDVPVSIQAGGVRSLGATSLRVSDSPSMESRGNHDSAP
ncbi:MAG TPA: IPT/TIG domain-containing protein [Bryobacteraceae bacterium]|nr:IPT/TIG domain-containing protein [Bryobacteraceae bacterium]